MIQTSLASRLKLALHRTMNSVILAGYPKKDRPAPQTYAEALLSRNARMLPTLAHRTQTFVVVDRRRLDPEDPTHATFCVTLEGQGAPEYIPGDMVYLRWKNHPADVQEILDLLGEDGDQRIGFSTSSSKWVPGWLEEASLRDALTNAVEIQEASKAMLRAYGLGDFIDHNRKQDELHRRYHHEAHKLGAVGADHPILDYRQVHLPSLLRDGRRPRPNLAEFLELQDRISARCYTLSGFEQVSPDRFRIQITVSQVDKSLFAPDGSSFAAPARTSRFLHSVEAGERIEGWLLPEVHRFPANLGRDVPTIVICTGSGIGGVLSLLRRGESRGPLWLIYGVRSRSKKSLYGPELEAFRDGGAISRLDYACSRPVDGEAPRQRVQDFLWEHRAELAAELDRGAHIYMSGRMSMGQDVNSVLRRILVDQGLAADDAEALATLNKWHFDLRLQASVSGT